ncbi:MAG: hypothetical protein RBT62_11280 [Spirochaetia bacterium]|jgi:hypothetical protein|nr:hypothetical protein [Spirochaetia bacterium]
MRKKVVAFVLAVTAGLGLYAQSIDDIVAIGDKDVCTIADLAVMAPAIVEAFPDDVALAERLEGSLSGYDAIDVLTKSKASLIVASSLRLRSSLLFIMFPLKRYAFRALVMDGIFSPASSGGETMSGLDLFNFISTIERSYAVAP